MENLTVVLVIVGLILTASLIGLLVALKFSKRVRNYFLCPITGVPFILGSYTVSYPSRIEVPNSLLVSKYAMKRMNIYPEICKYVVEEDLSIPKFAKPEKVKLLTETLNR